MFLAAPIAFKGRLIQYADRILRPRPGEETAEVHDYHDTATGVSAQEIQAGARRLLAENRGHQLAETRKQLGLAQKDIAAALGVCIARISQIQHGEVTSFEVIARYVEALGGR